MRYLANIRIIGTLITISLLFIVIGHIFQSQVQAKLLHPICHVDFIVDWWSVTHFILFMAFGIIEPNHHFTFAVGGATFEFIEDFMAGNKNTKLVNCSKNPKSFMCNGIQDGYWYGKFDDILINILGYTLGSALRTNVFPLIKCIN